MYVGCFGGFNDQILLDFWTTVFVGGSNETVSDIFIDSCPEEDWLEDNINSGSYRHKIHLS